jgi:hypothetical protein
VTAVGEQPKNSVGPRGVREYLRKVYALYIRGGVRCALEKLNCHAECLVCSGTIMLQSCYSGGTVLLEWRYSRVTAVLLWC